MQLKTIYQTLEDRETDLNELEELGPYPCNWENAWLGKGYYFWDSFIENAHWWGEEIRKYPDGYIICQAECDFSDEECFDLVGNTSHLIQLHDAYKLMKSKGLINKKTTVNRVITFFKNNLENFDFTAIRVYGIRSKSYHSRFSFTQVFEKNNVAYLDYKPPIQICFFTKKSMNLRSFRIVYPENYSIDFV